MSAAQLSYADTCEVQRIVLCDARVKRVRHVVVTFHNGGGARRFLRSVIEALPVTLVCGPDKQHNKEPPALQVSYGFSFPGLEKLDSHGLILAPFRTGAPAFAAGAWLRAAEHLGDSGESAAPQWRQEFKFDVAHCVITLHANDLHCLNNATGEIKKALEGRGSDNLSTYATMLPPIDGSRLETPKGQEGEWVHFGFRDALSRVAIRGWDDKPEVRQGAKMDLRRARKKLDTSWHQPGEFLLGHANDLGYNPWVLADAKPPVRDFFRNGSFAVLRVIEQKETEFQNFVDRSAKHLQKDRLPVPDLSIEALRDYVKAKLCGRWPNGDRFGAASEHRPGDFDPKEDFDYEHDQHGFGCPLGAHVRRMNPRGSTVALVRPRPLIRRGMPYGERYDATNADTERGLLGLFFCASIEDQFEHLLAQWGDRVPLGSSDCGSAKDPLVGTHEDARATFEIPRESGEPLRLDGLTPFTRTRGTVYLFYPALTTLRQMLNLETVKQLRDDEEVVLRQ